MKWVAKNRQLWQMKGTHTHTCMYKCVHTCTCTHTHTHACTHTDTGTYTHTHTHTRTHARTPGTMSILRCRCGIVIIISKVITAIFVLVTAHKSNITPSISPQAYMIQNLPQIQNKHTSVMLTKFLSMSGLYCSTPGVG